MVFPLSQRGKPTRCVSGGQSDWRLANQSGKNPITRRGECIQRCITRSTGGRPSVARNSFTGPLERAIDQEPVREAEEGALEPHRLGRRNPDVSGHALIDQAADDARLQVDGRHRHAEPLLRDAGAERDSGRGDDGVGIRVSFDVPVHLGHRRQDGAPRDDLEPFARVPEIGVGDRRARIVDRAHGQESHSLALNQLLEERIGQNGGPMPATLECNPEGQDRVDVTSAADGRQEHVERSGPLQQSASQRIL